MANRPAPAADFQAFLRRPGSLAFRTVARDLALTDIHPPLFFWGLHVQHFLVGLTPQNQSAINLGLASVFLVLLVRDIVAPRIAIGCLVLHLLQSMASWPGIVEQSFDLKPAVPSAWTKACDWSGTVITKATRCRR